MSQLANDVFYALHDGLPRQGPGDAASTRRAWEMLRALPPRPRVLDLGSGPGAQTLDLARLTRGTIVALDRHLPYLEELKERAWGAGVAARVHTLCADLARPCFRPASFDVAWGEGSIYFVGFAQGLRLWRPVLKPGGYIAVTELSWLRPAPPPAPRAFLQAAYPAIQDVQANLVDLRGAGYELVGYFVLPESAWWNDYYTPLERRLKKMGRKFRAEKDRAVLDHTRQEIELYREHARHYGYVFYVGRVPA